MVDNGGGGSQSRRRVTNQHSCPRNGEGVHLSLGNLCWVRRVYSGPQTTGEYTASPEACQLQHATLIHTAPWNLAFIRVWHTWAERHSVPHGCVVICSGSAAPRLRVDVTLGLHYTHQGWGSGEAYEDLTIPASEYIETAPRASPRKVNPSSFPERQFEEDVGNSQSPPCAPSLARGSFGSYLPRTWVHRD